MTREEAIYSFEEQNKQLRYEMECYGHKMPHYMMNAYCMELNRNEMAISALSENKGEWIPLKTRPMTEEESTYYQEWVEYGAEMFDCPLPDDGQEVLISSGGYINIDIFANGDRDGCYFEGVDIGNVEAWMPLPEPYKAEKTETCNGCTHPCVMYEPTMKACEKKGR